MEFKVSSAGIPGFSGYAYCEPPKIPVVYAVSTAMVPPENDVHKCPVCEGQGWEYDVFRQGIICRVCNGKGYIVIARKNKNA